MNHPTSCLILECLSNIHVDEKPIYRDPSLGANSTFNINAESQKYFFFVYFKYTPQERNHYVFEGRLPFDLFANFTKSCFPFWKVMSLMTVLLILLSHPYIHLHWSAFGTTSIMLTLWIYTLLWMQNSKYQYKEKHL